MGSHKQLCSRHVCLQTTSEQKKRYIESRGLHQQELMQAQGPIALASRSHSANSHAMLIITSVGLGICRRCPHFSSSSRPFLSLVSMKGVKRAQMLSSASSLRTRRTVKGKAVAAQILPAERCDHAARWLSLRQDDARASSLKVKSTDKQTNKLARSWTRKWTRPSH